MHNVFFPLRSNLYLSKQNVCIKSIHVPAPRAHRTRRSSLHISPCSNRFHNCICILLHGSHFYAVLPDKEAIRSWVLSKFGYNHERISYGTSRPGPFYHRHLSKQFCHSRKNKLQEHYDKMTEITIFFEQQKQRQ